MMCVFVLRYGIGNLIESEDRNTKIKIKLKE